MICFIEEIHGCEGLVELINMHNVDVFFLFNFGSAAALPESLSVCQRVSCVGICIWSISKQITNEV